MTQTRSLDYAKEEKKLPSSALLVAVGWRASCRHCWVEKSLREKNKRQKWNSGNRDEEENSNDNEIPHKNSINFLESRRRRRSWEVKRRRPAASQQKKRRNMKEKVN